MGNDFKFAAIGSVAELQGGYAFKSWDFRGEGVPVLKIKNIRHRDIDTTEVVFVSNEIAKDTKRFFAHPGDILISMTGSGMQAPDSIVGRVARYTGNDNAYLINQRVGRFIIKDSNILHLRYLYYYLSQKATQWEFVSIATGSANQVNISSKQITGMQMPLPSIQKQCAIAHILGSLDDKIELNRQMNVTLEGMAQAIFKSWFIDFDPVIDKALTAGNPIPADLQEKATRRQSLGNQRKPLPAEIADLFPDSFEDSELGSIPRASAHL